MIIENDDMKLCIRFCIQLGLVWEGNDTFYFMLD